MTPVCPNNLLLIALVFWCAAYGATIDDTEMDEDSDNYDPYKAGAPAPGCGWYSILPSHKIPNIQMMSAYQDRVMPPPPLPPPPPPFPPLPSQPGAPGLGGGFLPPTCSGTYDSYLGVSSLSCHKSSDSGGNSTFDNTTGNVNVSDVKQNKKVSEVARLFLTSPVSIIIIPSFYTAVCLLSVPTNICALLVFLRRIKPLNPAVIFMLNLAFADLLFAMVLPFKIFYHFTGNDWIFGEAMCHVVTAAFYWNMYCSILLITLISVDRLLSVVYPMDSLTWRSPRKAFIACTAMWILSFAGSVHIFFTDKTFKVSELNITTCHDIQPSQPFQYHKTYFIILCLFLFFLPLIITVLSYTRVIITLKKDQPGVPDASGRKRRAAMLTTTVLVMFVLCFMPTNIIQIIHQVMYTEKQVPENQLHPDWLYVVYLVFLCLGSLNCVLDPLVYYFGSTQFREEVCSLLGYNKTKRGSSSNQTPPGQSSPIKPTNQTNTKSDCKANTK